MSVQSLGVQAFASHKAGNFAEAERLYIQILALDPGNARASYLLGLLKFGQGKNAEALELIGIGLRANPGEPETLTNYGLALHAMGRFEEALASYDKALAARPGFAQALNNRGNTLILLKRFDEARVSLEKAVAIKPDFAEALYNLGTVLCTQDRTEEAFASFMRSAQLTYGKPENIPPDTAPVAPHKARHDREQRDYLAGGKAAPDAPAVETMFHLADGGRIAGPAVRPPSGNIEKQWTEAKPQIAVIDDFLTEEALDKLRRFCLGSTIWRRVYNDGYLGASPGQGFACPLLAQIAIELGNAFPAIFRGHPLRYLWAFKYDSTLSGINIHADQAAVNVNFWITPDEANLDPESGGLVVWDVAAPAEWDFAKYNLDIAAIREFLARNHARPVRIPYRANRAVIFDSDLFHETDRIAFKEGYLNRRINVTLLYGSRTLDDT